MPRRQGAKIGLGGEILSVFLLASLHLGVENNATKGRRIETKGFARPYVSA
jgi:hypothetical protein